MYTRINRFYRLHIECARENYRNPVMWSKLRIKKFLLN